MKSPLATIVVITCALFVAACTHSEASKRPVPEDAGNAAQSVFAKLKARDHEGLYEDASPAFKAANQKADFVAKIRDLEQFGAVLDVEPIGDLAVTPGNASEVANGSYTATFTFGKGPIDLSLRLDASSGEWKLDYYSYDVATTTVDPPYSADEAGADQLARRFLYLWQANRFDDLSTTMKIKDDPAKVRSFLEGLKSSGELLTLERTGYLAASSRGGKAVKAEYHLVFDKGKGYLTFLLVPQGGQWQLVNVKYDVEFSAGAGTHAADPRSSHVGPS
jgi:hypothetical protein